EAVLAAHPDVANAAVIAHTDHNTRRLIAYLVPDNPIDTTSLRDYLASRLPDYMIPAAFVTLDRLPVSRNGKLDRRALPAPNPTSTGQVAPRNDTEATVANIWTDILGIERAGIHDNFFELGGDSILSIQVASRLRTELGVEVSPRAL